MANQDREKWRSAPQSEKTPDDLLFLSTMAKPFQVPAAEPSVNDMKPEKIPTNDPFMSKLEKTYNSKQTTGFDLQGRIIETPTARQVDDVIKGRNPNSQ